MLTYVFHDVIYKEKERRFRSTLIGFQGDPVWHHTLAFYTNLMIPGEHVTFDVEDGA